ncbi:MAG: low specificity L-threonine aldolase [Clostridiales bacterium]|nr:low specificity L-threonine aldolase [Clostridiales bacterium]
MLHFDSDYMEGAHPEILRRLVAGNLQKQPGYGADAICASARRRIRTACGCPDAAVYFLTGGTQVNTVVIDALLNPCQGVVAAESGHVNVHEAGAIERTGHKVLALRQTQGKLEAGTLEDYLAAFWRDETHAHMVEPGMVYLSYPTEFGTLYTAQELEALFAVCRKYRIPLYLDGARLGYGLAAASDLDLAGLARRCSVFTIGGTKVGALFGEAVVAPDPGTLPRNFFSLIKQHGGLLVKGWLLGLQFEVLMDEGRYLACGAHGTRLGQRLKTGLAALGYEIWADSPTNQILVILDDAALKKLEGNASYSVWQPLPDGRTVVRFVTSWATAEAEVDALIALLK